MSKQFSKPFNPIEWPALPHDFTGDNMLGLSTNDATQRYVLGTRHLAWDGSIYKYGKAGATFTSYQLGVWDEATGAAVSWESIGGGSAIGSNEVTMTQGSITEDQYQGGLIMINHSTGGGHVYTIQGNEATTGTTTKFYLDQPLPVAVTTNDACELYANPYSTMAQGNSNGSQGFFGVPMALLTDTYHGWVKTCGPAYLASQSTVGDAYVGEGVWWRHDGSVDIHSAMEAAPVTSQYAGYVLVGAQSGDGPIIMLQGSI